MTGAARFEFGKNWQDFLARLSDGHIDQAQRSFEQFLGLTTLSGRDFLDVGCGSGLHSLIAHRLGAARIHSFDYDADSVAACRRLKADRAPQATHWTIGPGDILNADFLRELGTYDLVYAWGVLHHTGQMWKAVRHAAQCAKPGGLLHLALYNRHWTSPAWTGLKRFYCRAPRGVRKALLGAYAAAEWLRLLLIKRRNPQRVIREYPQHRGMIWMNDLRDWLGGYPYEYASIQEVRDFMTNLNFELVKCRAAASIGCSEFLFRRLAHSTIDGPSTS